MASKIKVEVKDTAPLTERPWTRHYDPGVPATLIYPKVPLEAMLDDAAESNANATATIFFNRKRTYKSISDAAWRFANGLRRLGVMKGDRVALVLPNSPQFVIAFYGALRAGATVVPCNPLYTPPELQHQLADSGATVVVALSRLYPVVKAARANTAVEHVIVTNIKEEMPRVLRVLFTLAKEKKDGHRQPFAGDAGAISMRQALSAPADPFDAGTGPDDLAVLQYTGGTTGSRSKPACRAPRRSLSKRTGDSSSSPARVSSKATASPRPRRSPTATHCSVKASRRSGRSGSPTLTSSRRSSTSRPANRRCHPASRASSSSEGRSSWAATTSDPTRPLRPSATAGFTPATSRRSTLRDTSPSSTAKRK